MRAFGVSNLVFYPDFWDEEEPGRYELGGYHPIIIGNVLRSPSGTSSYRIIQKLGHGSFATVWLAENLNSQPKYVAVKVSTADGLSSSEADCLRSMSSPYIVPAFDSFCLEGPNGTHHVLITEVLVPLYDFLSVLHRVGTLKTIIWQLVKAVEYLHAAGLVHGDLHLGNAGVTLPQLQSLRLTGIVLNSDYPVLIPILLDNITDRPESLPPYLTCRCDMKKLYENLSKDVEYEPQAKLFDFGSVRRQGDNGGDLVCTRLSCAPEILRAKNEDEGRNSVLEPASDIWALGTVIFEIMAGFPLFDGGDLYSPTGNMLADEEEWWSQTRLHLKNRWADDTDCDALVALLRKIFLFEPSKRISAAAIAQDEWFREIGEARDQTAPLDHLCTPVKEM